MARTYLPIPDSPGFGRLGGTPYLSVVVIAHGRRKYLLEAVGSALAQELPRGEYEVLVVKDFVDPEIDRELDRRGVRHFEPEAPPLGAKVAFGATVASGEVLAYLEDDDLFDPKRLGHLTGLFRSDPSLGYVRNGQWWIDERGRPLPAGAYGQAHRNLVRLGPMVVPAAKLARYAGRLGQVDPDFNLSSIAVRRSILLPFREELARRPAALDSSLFYCALAARATIRVEPNPLTGYRIHGTNASLWSDASPEALARRGEFQRTFLTSFEPIYDRLARDGPPAATALAGSALFGTRVLYRLLTGEGGRGALAADLRRFWHESPYAVLRYRWDISAWGLVGWLAPRWARAEFVRRRGAERAGTRISDDPDGAGAGNR